ncbi:hypothetical protein [Spirosoma endbachense]|uniref:Uncharacterized protein n=1 Tax=Spirosoma endbachense TaxID=2666025 RepID=A0A6P1VQ98_9BACT|nr:hypothetical protein [Spirosoma endbachense]QHV94598.1 hypothetical protein GJR95_06030 [Spirosoma endbachense]
MKLLLCLVLNLVLVSVAVKAQKIPKGADAIELTTTLADSALFESVQSYLEEAGFDIDVANEEEGTIVTEYRTVTEFKTIKEPIQIRLLATLENGVVLFKGQATSRNPGNTYENEPIVNDESSNGVSDGEFLFINEIINSYAKTLDQATVEYNVP